MTTTTGRVRNGLALVAVVQVVLHALTTLLPGHTVQACLPVVGQIARAGVHLARLGRPGACPDALAADTRQLALGMAVTAVPLLLAHVAAVAGIAAVWSWLHRVLGAARAVLAAVRLALPGTSTVVVPRPRPLPVRSADDVRSGRPAPSGVRRRGPPVVVPA